MHIDFHDETNSVSEDYIDLIQRLLDFAAKKEGVTSEAELSVNFVDNKEIQVLNRNYRQKDTPTDVISFAMQESNEDEMEIIGADGPLVLGDIVISVDKAKEQSIEYDHSLERELGFLAVHGFLHLLGYDHMKEEDEKRMFSRQEEILGEFGVER
ncbi:MULTISPECIES: rRNA maturation RNase YbeY [Oceanobacillus]|uniref:Endoribonuclease YbeY n=1 Tax=Oceanobacillus kimchii TaxID=746691 RepID=A0ABQ5TNB5_9BACI|nr:MULTISPECIES: rRNA maturation RNase YbeY [Oceanobacillus]MBT2598293.1 rRNA maturation RNase YbeY [Oceanobacillus sp. ISL-74]MBT2651212.1 rRNA maturation RNase YbeY [Oceanobacillus sp. ISL-73]MCT1575871.1 rRNA maturation RNase YbeY [Oceanobacillus kimchii]MCT2135508.1 rRNA maturation RNase YbeY [Oceanobacillus kimchii]OEH55614.1 rRNA maturation RNase YbeY [Oceanobacillus sp. E9]